MSKQVKVIDNLSSTILFETSLQNISEAYSFATLMENEGLDIRIQAPGLPETLIYSLGANKEDLAEFSEMLNEEIEAHETKFEGCTFCEMTV
jgi:hypothetical protein